MKNFLFLFCMLPALTSCAQSNSIKITVIPYPLEVINQPVSYKTDDSALTIRAAGKTNLFNHPNGATRIQNAPMVLFQPEQDFTLTAKVSGELQSIYDVVALVVYQDEDIWAKLCYENSVDQQPTIVSVVTRTYSDDCNSISAGEDVWLSVTRKGNEFSFFYTADKKSWKMIRHFHLDITSTLKAGFTVHGSRGEGLSGTFSEIELEEFESKEPINLRRDN
ncbi:MAG: DUF1349 domain-containing protein [Bacteroides sp.]|nr:DUF1349 domain-containing protein [Bacteroides sp.]